MVRGWRHLARLSWRLTVWGADGLGIQGAVSFFVGSVWGVRSLGIEGEGILERLGF